MIHSSAILIPRVADNAGVRAVAEDVLVFWRPSSVFSDANIFYVDTTVREILIFNPIPFTGSDFFSKLIRDLIISKKRVKVGYSDLRGPNKAPNSKGSQLRHLESIILNTIQTKSSYVVSDERVTDVTLKTENLRTKNVISISIIRNPYAALIASFYYHKYGDYLFKPDESTTKSEFVAKLSKVVKEVEEKVANGDDFRTYANQVSATVPFCGRNISKCKGVHPGRSKWVLGKAKKNAEAKNTFVLLMEDFAHIPKLLQNIAPQICYGLQRYCRDVKWPVWLDTEINLSEATKARLKMDNRIKLEIQFYEWIKRKYYKEKTLILNNNLPIQSSSVK